MSHFILICAGGALGTGGRYLVSTWALKLLGPAFPYGTLAVNLLGSFLVAALMYLGTETTAVSTSTRVVLASGVLGGFTTYSAFSYETMRYVQLGSWALALSNVIITLFGSLAACMLGWSAAKWVYGG